MKESASGAVQVAQRQIKKMVIQCVCVDICTLNGHSTHLHNVFKHIYIKHIHICIYVMVCLLKYICSSTGTLARSHVHRHMHRHVLYLHRRYSDTDTDTGTDTGTDTDTDSYSTCIAGTQILQKAGCFVHSTCLCVCVCVCVCVSVCNMVERGCLFLNTQYSHNKKVSCMH